MQPTPTGDAPRRAFFKKRDILVALLVLAVAAGLLVLLPREPAATVVVTVGVGDAQTSQTLRLGRDRDVEIDGAFPVHLEIRDGAVRFANSACPDHLCEGFGWLRHEGDWAACVPAGVMLRVEESAAGG